jgi:hypothetical protein
MIAGFVTATADTSSIEVLDARIADAKNAAAAARKAADTICHNAGYAMAQRKVGSPSNASEQLKECTDATQASMDAIGFIGFLYEQRSHLTGEPLSPGYACSGKPSLGVPHPDAKGHYSVCPKDPDDHSYKFWIIASVRMQVGSAKETWSAGGIISMRRYNNEAECKEGIAKYEEYPSKVPYTLMTGVTLGDVCVEVFIPDVRELPH